jgi:hypothetical protein
MTKPYLIFSPVVAAFLYDREEMVPDLSYLIQLIESGVAWFLKTRKPFLVRKLF